MSDTRKMRDTNDMMEDAICEDTMMECSGDGGGLEDLVNLASHIADSAPSIRDAAERLLTLLGVDEDDDASSSEDEGVEVDLEDSDTDEPQDTRLLHQLAASLAQELKYAKQNSSNTKLSQNQNSPGELYGQSMDFAQEINHVSSSSTNYHQIHQDSSNPFASYSSGIFYQNDDDYKPQTHLPRQPPPPYQYKPVSQFENRSQIHPEKSFGFGLSNSQNYTTEITPSYVPSVFDPRSRVEDVSEEPRLTDPVSWGIGWDACATEALRYLVEDEGLPLHHPTVVAMKNHLDLQRSRVVSQFAA